MGLIDKKVSIFLDTNVFQTFLGKKKTSDVLLYLISADLLAVLR